MRRPSAGLAGASAGVRELQAQLQAASSQVSALQPRLELARLRVRQNRELVATGAGDRFALEQAEANVVELQAQLATATANEAQVMQKLSGRVNGELASVAAARADIATAQAGVDASRASVADAQWNLDQTAMYAPADGHAINVQLRPGSIVVPFPMAPAMTFVENETVVIALYAQNELRAGRARQRGRVHARACIRAGSSRPRWIRSSGRRADGQVAQSATVPQTGVFPQVPGRFPVKFAIAEKDRELFLAAGAAGAGAVYTEHGAIFHIIRKVIVRVGSITDYLVLKLH